MNETSRSASTGAAEPPAHPQPPPRPAFGFLLGGTTLGIFFGCLLLCAGATPPHVIIVILSICGAITGGFLETLWPKNWPETPPTTSPKPKLRTGRSEHECQRCGEVFEPGPVICPMCGGEQPLRSH